MAVSGKSKSEKYPNGKRRRDQEGKKLAPRSLRPEKRYLSECTDKELEEVGISRDDSKKDTNW